MLVAPDLKRQDEVGCGFSLLPLLMLVCGFRLGGAGFCVPSDRTLGLLLNHKLQMQHALSQIKYYIHT